MSKHTPGPWKTYYAGPFNEDLIVTQIGGGAMYDPGCGSQVASISFQPGGAKGEEMVANARLIAAAPDLLKLLREVMDVVEVVLDDESEMDTWLDHAHAAIAKVEGR
jgi:hypothetical protein